MEKITAQYVIEKACKKEVSIVNWAYDLKWLDGIEMEKFREEIKKLIHHKDTTVGLWATDNLDKILECEEQMFQISY